MEYLDFEELAETTNLQQKYWPFLWRSWRFEQFGYMKVALNDFFRRVKQVKYPNEFQKNGFGNDLRKYRDLRPVTKELLLDDILNVDKILLNCDIGHDRDLTTLFFPLVFSSCDHCGRRVSKRSAEGVWICLCGEQRIDKFYKPEAIQSIWNSERHRRTPKEILKELEDKLLTR